MNINSFLEQKILEFRFSGDANKSQKVFELIQCLSPLGFEIYIQKVFEKIYGKEFYHTGKIGTGDGSIDIMGSNIFIQCKKYHRNRKYKEACGVGLLREFIGAITFCLSGNQKIHEVDKYFVTTQNFTDEAKRYAEKMNIELYFYDDILDFLENIYSLKDFMSDYRDKKNIYFYTSQQLVIFIPYASVVDYLQEEDYEFYFREVRKIISENILDLGSSNSGLVFNNTTLKLFSEKRVKNNQLYFQLKNDLHKNGSKDFKNLKKYESKLLHAIQILAR